MRAALLALGTALCIGALLLFGTVRIAEARCRSKACWGRVHDARAIRWCRRHDFCIWRHRFHARPLAWQRWAWATARCESGLRFWIATGNGFYGGMQYTPSTARAAGFDRLPHLTSKWEQLTRSIDFARRNGTQHWPVCGR